MDDIRKSFSKLKKDVKHRFGGKKRAPDRAEVDTTGEGVSSSASLLGPNPLIAVGGHDGEGSRIKADVSQARLSYPIPHPEPVPADEGRLDDPQRKEVDIGEKEISQRHSHVDDVGIVAGGVLSQGVEQVSSPLSVISSSRKQEPDSMWTLSP